MKWCIYVGIYVYIYVYIDAPIMGNSTINTKLAFPDFTFMGADTHKHLLNNPNNSNNPHSLSQSLSLSNPNNPNNPSNPSNFPCSMSSSLILGK